MIPILLFFNLVECQNVKQKLKEDLMKNYDKESLPDFNNSIASGSL